MRIKTVYLTTPQQDQLIFDLARINGCAAKDALEEVFRDEKFSAVLDELVRLKLEQLQKAAKEKICQAVN